MFYFREFINIFLDIYFSFQRTSFGGLHLTCHEMMEIDYSSHRMSSNLLHNIFIKDIYIYTVKPALTVTLIQRSPAFNSQF